MMSKRMLFAGFATVACLCLCPDLAQAESRLGLQIFIGHDEQRYGSQDTYRLGYGRGYQDGYHHGRDDADDHDGFNFWHEKNYRNADSGYKGWYGPKFEYQRGYREGYESAYRRAYAAAHHSERGHDHSRCETGYGYTREVPRYADPRHPYGDRRW